PALSPGGGVPHNLVHTHPPPPPPPRGRGPPPPPHDSYYWAEREGNTDSWPVPGTGDGMAYVHHRPESKAGYLDVYAAEAHAWRGDIAMEIWVFDTKPIPKKKIMDLAKRQMERL
ncbi:hypothetical protein ACFW2E_12040, partial [Streptomyces sp. NPDC058964]